MFTGSIDSATGLLLVQGIVRIPPLGVFGQVNFEVDTGAEVTCVMSEDIQALGVDLEAMETLSRVPVRGFGGAQAMRLAHGFLAFRDDDSRFLYSLDFLIPDPSATPALPSVLGRDVLQRWRMVYDHQLGELSFTVRHADRTVTRPSA